MAWQGIVSGAADCAVPNPLSGLVKHTERDHTDTFARPGGPNGEASSSNAFRTTPQPHHVGGAQAPGGPQDFFMDHPSALPGIDVGNIGPARSYAGPPPQFVDGVARGLETLRLDNAWQQSRQPSQQGGSPSPAVTESSWKDSYRNYTSFAAGPSNSTPSSAEVHEVRRPMPYTMMHNNMAAYQMGGYGGGATMNANIIQQQSKGKGRIVELGDINLGDKEWEEQFANIDKLTKAATVEKEKDKDQHDEANTGSIEQQEENAEKDDMEGLRRAYMDLQKENEKHKLMDDELAELAELEADFGTKLNEDFDLDAMLTNPAPFKFTPEEENPFFDMPGDPFERGQELLRNGALLSEAALAFEEACRQNPGRGEAWRALGDTCAANEQEHKATRALERALACKGEGGQGTWMSLAVCYVNEGFESRALKTLEKWLTATYPHVMENRRALDVSNPWDEHQRTIENFLEAARAGPIERRRNEEMQQREDLEASSTVDPDVQVGLGILFYSQSDYEHARDCFEAALSVRPKDFLLWNRLGATLANGGSPEEAIDAYRKALEIRPTFTRAIYNLGVSCLNVHCYHEAIEHLLTVLSMHQTKENESSFKGKGKDDEDRVPGWDEMLDPYSDQDPSMSIWNTLRRGFLCLERGYLAAMCIPGTKLDLFRKEGYDFGHMNKE